jgi:hypothetical protein
VGGIGYPSRHSSATDDRPFGKPFPISVITRYLRIYESTSRGPIEPQPQILTGTDRMVLNAFSMIQSPPKVRMNPRLIDRPLRHAHTRPAPPHGKPRESPGALVMALPRGDSISIWRSPRIPSTGSSYGGERGDCHYPVAGLCEGRASLPSATLPAVHEAHSPVEILKHCSHSLAT